MRRFARYFHERSLATRSVITACLSFLVILAVSAFMHEIFVHRLGWLWFQEQLIVSALAALAIGFISFVIMREREHGLQRRFEEIGYLNHHIRNALTQIEYAHMTVADAEIKFSSVRDASQRIQLCLEKISKSEDLSGISRHPQRV